MLNKDFCNKLSKKNLTILGDLFIIAYSLYVFFLICFSFKTQQGIFYICKFYIFTVIIAYYIINQLLFGLYELLNITNFNNKLNLKNIENVLSKNNLPTTLAKKEYWRPLIYGFSFLKPKVRSTENLDILYIGLCKIYLLNFITIYFLTAFLGANLHIQNLGFIIGTIVVQISLFTNMFSGKRHYFNYQNAGYYFRDKYSDNLITDKSTTVCLQVLPLYIFSNTILGYQVYIIYKSKNTYYDNNNKYDRHLILSYNNFNHVKKCAEEISKFINVPIIMEPSIKYGVL